MFIKLFFVALPTFFVIDMLWLGFIARNFYRSQIGFLLKDEVNWPAAVAFYLIFIIGLVHFVIAPAVEKGSWSAALLNGLLFGLVTYAAYDLTNLATVKNWPLFVTIVDLLWGMTLAGSVSLISFFIAKKLGIFPG
jgi:uncharacterized membrane protein